MATTIASRNEMVNYLLEKGSNYNGMHTAENFAKHVLRNYDSKQVEELGSYIIEAAYNVLCKRIGA